MADDVRGLSRPRARVPRGMDEGRLGCEARASVECGSPCKRSPELVAALAMPRRRRMASTMPT
eukprot:5077255-Alexandrium_andersonii.AAC.1